MPVIEGRKNEKSFFRHFHAYHGVNDTIAIFFLYCIVLYRIVLFCFVKYYILLLCIVLFFCIAMFRIVLYFFVLYCIVLLCIVLYILEIKVCKIVFQGFYFVCGKNT